ncbi:Peptidyl-prolyl cis-trans isomerase-like 2 [Bienertia sinuspersici]
MNISFSIIIDGFEGDMERQARCKVELKPWHFWSKKGQKQQEEEGNHQVDVYWDLRSAKFTGNSPEPCSDYYLALVSDEEVVLLLGDYKKKAYKRTKKRPALVDAIQSLKKETVYAKKSFATRARFTQGRWEHDVVVESSTNGPKDPEMWISIDGIVLIHVKNLQWKFRGNETVVVNKTPIQVLWDVHAWLFCSPGTGCGLFIFKPGSPEIEMDKEGSNRTGVSDDNSSYSTFYSTQPTQTKMVDFFLLLQAWKTD